MKHFLPLVVLIIFFFSACNDDPDPFIIYNGPDEFTLSMKEVLNEDGRQFAVEMTSIEGFDCEGATIDLSFSRSGDEIYLTVNDIKKPNDCESGIHKAKGSITMGNLDEGTYPMTISLRGVVTNTGLLSVTSDAYEFISPSDEELKGILFDYFLLNRIPDGFLWGRLEYNNVKQDALWDRFLEEMNNIDIYSSHLPIGAYGFFKIDTGNNLNWPESFTPAFQNTRSFILDGTGVPEDEIEKAVETFKDSYEDQVELDVDLFTTQGNEY